MRFYSLTKEKRSHNSLYRLSRSLTNIVSSYSSTLSKTSKFSCHHYVSVIVYAYDHTGRMGVPHNMHPKALLYSRKGEYNILDCRLTNDYCHVIISSSYKFYIKLSTGSSVLHQIIPYFLPNTKEVFYAVF